MAHTVRSLKEKSATELMIIHGALQRLETPAKSRWLRRALPWAGIIIGIALAQCGAR